MRRSLDGFASGSFLEMERVVQNMEWMEIALNPTIMNCFDIG